jgi:hypothetical protein
LPIYFSQSPLFQVQQEAVAGGGGVAVAGWRWRRRALRDAAVLTIRT